MFLIIKINSQIAVIKNIDFDGGRENQNFTQKSNFRQKLKFCSKIEILLENLNVAQKSNFCS